MNKMHKVILKAVVFSWLMFSYGISCSVIPQSSKSIPLASSVFMESLAEDEAQPQMQLRGFGTKSIFSVKAFEAGLYLQEDALNQDPLLNISKRIEVKYFVNIPGRKLNDVTIRSMKENISKDEYAKISAQVKQMSEYFVDLRPGDKFALAYVPNVGTRFLLNDQLVGIIEGEDFARALFSVWFGKKPFDQRLKDQILGLQKFRAL